MRSAALAILLLLVFCEPSVLFLRLGQPTFGVVPLDNAYHQQPLERLLMSNPTV